MGEGVTKRSPAQGTVGKAAVLLSLAVQDVRRNHGVAVGEETAIHLLEGGIEDARTHRDVSERTFRHQIERTGATVSDLLTSLRVAASIRFLGAKVPMNVAARYLGFGDVTAYRRFLRHVFNTDVRSLRREVRDGKNEET